MKKLIIAFALCACSVALFAQKSKGKTAATTQEVKVAMTANQWNFPANSAEFITHKGLPALKILNGGDKIALKDFQLADGTIEYDIEPQEETFAGIYFRMADSNETEFFYLRVQRGGNPAAMDAAQYAPYHKGVNMWDMYPYYQGPANFQKMAWNHVKLVISGKQMLVYINDMARPTLEIPQLEGNTQTGGIAFSGKSFIANLVIRPGDVEGLPARPGFDPTHHDPRYIRTWQVSEPQPLPKGRELFEGDFAKPAMAWQDVQAERRGLINLTRIFGASPSRRFVWLRTRLTSATEQKRRISLGFSDEVWVYLNRQPVFVDKNTYVSPGMRKTPDGRISIENAAFDISLKAGENDLLIGVANDFFGWGIIARLDNLEGIDVSVNFPPPVIQPKDLSKYVGTYKSPEASIKITITVDKDVVMGQATGQPAVVLEYFEKDKFRLASANVVLEFIPEENKVILKEGGSALTFVKE